MHWEPKPLSLRRLSDSLELSAASFVFLDDSPAEILAVRTELPEVMCIRVPDSPDGLSSLLCHHWSFDVWASAVTTAEDTLRTQMYREKLARKRAYRDARRNGRPLPLSAFLRELSLRVEVHVCMQGGEPCGGLVGGESGCVEGGEAFRRADAPCALRPAPCALSPRPLPFVLSPFVLSPFVLSPNVDHALSS